jgi:hypothetical protein
MKRRQGERSELTKNHKLRVVKSARRRYKDYLRTGRSGNDNSMYLCDNLGYALKMVVTWNPVTFHYEDNIDYLPEWEELYRQWVGSGKIKRYSYVGWWSDNDRESRLQFIEELIQLIELS